MAGNKFLTFNNGEKMPVIGIGTWQVIKYIYLVPHKYVHINRVSTIFANPKSQF